MAYSKIAVGIDGSDTALQVVDRAASIAAANDAELVIVTVYHKTSGSVLSAPVGDSVSSAVVREDMADEYLAEASTRAKQAGAAKVSTLKREGSPATVLVATVTEIGADLLVVGNRGMNSMLGRIFGNIPADVMHHSSVDVLVVHSSEK